MVTYDLAVALKAYSIQALDTPRYDSLIILLGNFYLEMALYGGYVTYMAESGAEFILTEAGVLAEGSLNGFLKGKFYNRCSRIHEIFASALEKKLFERLLHKNSDIDLTTINEEIKIHTDELETYAASNKEITECLRSYNAFFKSIMNGELGPTAQYWAQYIYMINRLHCELMK